MIYDAYAPIYRQAGLEQFGRQLATRIALRFPAPAGAAALDLACGSGAATLVLARAGYRTVGVDRAPAMLALAAQEAAAQGLAIEWVQGDLTALPEHAAPAAGRFTLITCLFDSLNYLLGDADLALACRGAARLLAPGGQFIFDLNTEQEFLSWDERDEVVCDTPDLLVCQRLTYDARERRAHGQIIWFRRIGERWWRGEETHTERPWRAAEITDALAAAGLRLRECVTPLWQPAQGNEPRLLYVAEAAG